MIANLFMYHCPELVDAHDRFWSLIREHLVKHGIDGPQTLLQDGSDLSVWQDAALLFSQTCGMPYRLGLHTAVDLIGTPDYRLPECPPGYYRSAIVVRADDARSEFAAFKDSTLAFNNVHSQSGYAAPYWHAHHHGFWFNKTLDAKKHWEAGRAVAQGRADIASIDAVTWTLMQRYADFTHHLRTLDWTTPTPGLPYIAAKGVNTSVVFKAITEAIDLLSAADRHSLLIQGLVRIPKSDYLAVPNPPL